MSAIDLAAGRLTAQFPASVLRTGRDEFVVRAPRGSSRELPGTLVRALLACSGSATLAEHAARWAQIARLPRDVAEGQLGALLSKGLLIDVEGLVQIGEHPVPATRASGQLRYVGVVTAGRPGAVARCVASHAGHFRHHGRRADFVVVDSSSAEVQAANRESLAGLSRRDGVTVAHIGPSDKERFAKRLSAATGVDEEVVRFGILDTDGIGNDTGANRNALLLAFAGEAFAAVDDDTIAELRTLPGRTTERLHLSGRGDPTSVTPFLSFGEAYEGTAPEGACLFEAHERLLGGSIPELARVFGPASVSVDRLTSELWAALLPGPHRVGLTFLGLTGDCGSAYPAFHLFDGDTVIPAEVADDPERCAPLMASRVVHRAVAGPTVTRGHFCMTTSFAIDCRTVVPAFFPGGRGQDLCFGTLMKACRPDCLFGYLPWSIGHHPLPARSVTSESLWNPSVQVPLTTMVGYCVRLASPLAGRCPEPLVQLGRHLQEMARWRSSDFEETLRQQAWIDLENMAHILSQKIAASPGRRSWAERAQAYLQYRLRSGEDLDFRRASANEVGDGLTKDPTRVQSLVGRYGRLLESWPALFAAARKLGPRGYLPDGEGADLACA